jgi:hypothetical protein
MKAAGGDAKPRVKLNPFAGRSPSLTKAGTTSRLLAWIVRSLKLVNIGAEFVSVTKTEKLFVVLSEPSLTMVVSVFVPVP